jgi:protein-S-isoprenylcysteine O-methyltransferase Ste14
MSWILPLKLALLVAQIQLLLKAVSPEYFKGEDSALAPRDGVKRGITGMIRSFKILIKVCLLRVRSGGQTTYAEQPLFVAAPLIESLSALCLAASTPETAQLRGWLSIPPSMPSNALDPTALWFLGIVLTVGGGYLRVRAVKDLGRFFTLEPDISGEHKLITTGAFSLLRQPGSAGILFAMIGMDITLCSSGTWTYEVLWRDICGLGAWHLYACIVVGINLACQLLTATAIVWNTFDEERVLEQKFGDEFRRWKVQTPWKLIPGIL